jgi:hypothetical protein
MKRLFVFLLLAQGFAVKAQHEWWPVHPGHTLYFSMDTTLIKSSKDRIWGIKINDSLLVKSDKRYVFNQFLNYEHQPSKFNCVFSIISSPLGSFMDIKGDSFILYTDFLYPIIFRKNPVLGDSIFIPKTDSNSFEVTIKLKHIDLINLFGTMDSVRIYTVNTHPYISCYDSIVLSKTFGLIRTPNIKLIDKFASNNSRSDIKTHEWNQTGTMSLVAHSHIPTFDLQPLTFLDCFTFEVGDVRHIVELDERNEFSVMNAWPPTKTKIIKNIIIEKVSNKTEYNDSFVYSLDRDIYSSIEIKTATSYELSNNKWKQTISKTVMKQQHPLDYALIGTINFTDKIIIAVRNNKYGVAGLEQLATEHLFKLNDTCLNTDFDLQAGPDYLFIKNNGGPYFSAYNNDAFSGSWENYHERKLLYYSNSQGTWGTPYPFPLSVNEHNGSKKNAVKCYPNPAKQNFTIESKEVQSITITDITGKIVYENKQAEPLTTIACKDWLAGVYVVHVSSATQRNQAKLIITH